MFNSLSLEERELLLRFVLHIECCLVENINFYRENCGTNASKDLFINENLYIVFIDIHYLLSSTLRVSSKNELDSIYYSYPFYLERIAEFKRYSLLILDYNLNVDCTFLRNIINKL